MKGDIAARATSLGIVFDRAFVEASVAADLGDASGDPKGDDLSLRSAGLQARSDRSDSMDHEVQRDWHRRPTVSVDVAAQLLGISRASTFRAVHRGELPSIRLGRRIIIPTARLRELLGLDA